MVDSLATFNDEPAASDDESGYWMKIVNEETKYPFSRPIDQRLQPESL